MNDNPRCNRSGQSKTSYSRRYQAEASASFQTGVAGRPIYVYFCKCGYFHLTRKKQPTVDEIVYQRRRWIDARLVDKLVKDIE